VDAGVARPVGGIPAEDSIVDDLVTPPDEAARTKAQRAVLGEMADVLEHASPAVRRILGEETGTDIDRLRTEAGRALS
jgi:hypothetical protein